MLAGPYEKKIDKSIDFLRGGEKKVVFISCLGHDRKTGVSGGLNGAGSEIYT